MAISGRAPILEIVVVSIVQNAMTFAVQTNLVTNFGKTLLTATYIAVTDLIAPRYDTLSKKGQGANDQSDLLI